MNISDLLADIILGIVEGITEFLPISSTGHLIVASALLNYPAPNIRDTFDIFIQLGAILAVIVFFARDLFSQLGKLPTDRATQRFWLYIVIAFLPAAVVGFLLRKWIKATLFNPIVVAISLIVGGILFLLIERRPRDGDTKSLETISLTQSILIGIAQIFALIPGVSRSGASILGGTLAGLDRATATRFSFYLAIPTLGGATIYELFSALKDGIVQMDQLPYFLLGAAVAFFVALASIAWLLRYVAAHDFRLFGIYRIIVGFIILALVVLAPALLH